MAERIIQTETLQGIANALRGGASQSASDKIDVTDFGTVAAGLKADSDGLVALIGREETSFTIPEGITSIGVAAFKDYTNLEEVDLPSTLLTIAREAFEGCTKLESVDIPNGVTIINASTFNGCYLLENINLPQTLKEIKDLAFESCAIKNIDIPQAVTKISHGAFFACESLESITIPEGVTTIGSEVFRDCKALAEINLPSTITTLGDFLGTNVFEGINANAVINCAFSEGAVSGAPWGAPNTVTINYDVSN